MRKYGKKYQEAQKLVEAGRSYTVAEASELIKKVSTTKFDATVSVQFNLGLDVKQADQQLRGAFVLPNGTGKTRTVLAITNKIDEAKAAGADFVGGKDMCEKIKNENWFGFDVIVATPDMMGELGRLGKILGPKGLMPNPKTGTVSPNIAAAIKEIKAGKVEYRTDKNGNIHVSIGRASFEPTIIADNLKAVIDTMLRVKPASVKGQYVKNCVISTTMGPSIKVTFNGR